MLKVETPRRKRTLAGVWPAGMQMFRTLSIELHRHQNEGGKTTIELERLEDGSLRLFYYDIGDDARRVFGDSDYEAWASVPPTELSKLAFVLLAEKYRGRADALSDFRTFCEQHEIPVAGGSWA